MELQLTYMERANRVHVIQSALVSDAKQYILENCEKVTDWKNLFLHVINGNNINNPNKLGEFMYAPRLEQKWVKYMKEHGAELPQRADRSIKTVTEPVLDEYDGDFSITINGLQWWWINDEAVIDLAVYIERKLNPEFYA